MIHDSPHSPCESQVSDVTEGVCWWLRPLDRGLGLRPRTTEEPEPRTEETRGMCLLGPGALSLFHMIISLLAVWAIKVKAKKA